MPRALIVVLLLQVGLATYLWHARERELRRRRRAHDALFDRTRDAPRLTRWLQDVAQAFPAAARLPELESVQFEADRVGSAHQAVALAAQRFGYPRQQIELVIGQAPGLPHAAGAAVVATPSVSGVLDGDRLQLTVSAPASSGPRRLYLAEATLAQDELLAIVAAHEVAHLALADARLARSGREDEEITELAMVLAGYGPLMFRHRYVEQRITGPGRELGWRISGLGTLSQPAIAFLREERSRFALCRDDSSAAPPAASPAHAAAERAGAGSPSRRHAPPERCGT